MTQTTPFLLNLLPPFDFQSAATAHGWIALAPNAWNAAQQTLQRIEQLTTGKVVRLEVRSAGTLTQPQLSVHILHLNPLTPLELAEIERAVQHMFRLDEDFTEFYQLCDAQGDHWCRLVTGAGRLLRSPTVFEDAIKTICTTNTTWSGTIRMMSNLVNTLGTPFDADPTLRAFPTPEAIANAHPALLTEIRLGYRGASIHQLAQQVAGGELNLEAFRDLSIPSEVLKQRLLALRGIGPYAAHTLMMLLGRYEELAIDSEMRAFTSKRYFNGGSPTDREIRALYTNWGNWKYLAYWFDLSF